MAEVIRMPGILAGATEAAIQTWLVGEGARVDLDQGLAEIETDKAIVELTAETSGIVGRLLVGEGDTVSVGEPILVLLSDSEGPDAVAPALAAAGVRSHSVGEPEEGAAVFEEAVNEEPEERHEARTSRVFVSPLVRRLAAEAGVPLSDIRGTGPRGRIVRRDLERHLSERASARQAAVNATVTVTAAPTPPAETSATPEPAPLGAEDVPLDRMRRAIARRLTESKSTVPHFYLSADCRVDALLELRRTVNQTAPRKISVNDFVLKAVAGALVDTPSANAVWNGDSIRRFATVDISVAVATEGGLTTPVLRGVERLPLSEISAVVADLAARAREGRLRQHELEGGSFSVSNLGMYGTAQFSAILNPPQSGILAVGAARATPVIEPDGDLGVGQVMTVTLSADHRVLDGAVAAEWLAAFQRRIENPLSILI